MPISGHKYDDNGVMIPPTRYDIINNRSGERVGSAKQRTRALNMVDKHDNNYGAYAHRAVPIYEPSDT